MLEEGDYAGAVTALKASQALLPSPNTELLIGHAQRLGGQPVDAARTYGRVIATAGERVRAGEERYQRALEEAGRWQATLRSGLVEIEVFVVGAPPGTAVTVNGTPVTAQQVPRGLTAKLLHEPGPIEVVATTPSGASERESRETTPGGEATFALDLGGKDAAPAPTGERFSIPPPPLPTWIAAGVGAAGFVTFALFGAMSASAASDLDACSPSCPASLQDTADGGARDQTIANVGLVIGALGLVTAGVLWVVWPEDEAAVAHEPSARPPKAALRVGTTRADLQMSF